jgi:hypothetical protein
MHRASVRRIDPVSRIAERGEIERRANPHEAGPRLVPRRGACNNRIWAGPIAVPNGGAEIQCIKPLFAGSSNTGGDRRPFKA